VREERANLEMARYFRNGTDATLRLAARRGSQSTAPAAGASADLRPFLLSSHRERVQVPSRRPGSAGFFVVQRADVTSSLGIDKDDVKFESSWRTYTFLRDPNV